LHLCAARTDTKSAHEHASTISGDTAFARCIKLHGLCKGNTELVGKSGKTGWQKSPRLQSVTPTERPFIRRAYYRNDIADTLMTFSPSRPVDSNVGPKASPHVLTGYGVFSKEATRHSVTLQGIYPFEFGTAQQSTSNLHGVSHLPVSSIVW
jgi:hypothetical protein